MPDILDIQFVPLSAAPAGSVLLLAGQELALGSTARGIDERAKGALSKAARAADFTGKAKTSIEVLAPSGIDAARLILAGTGRAGKELDRLQLGGFAFAQLSARKGEVGTIVADPADPGEVGAEVFAADMALGALLRSYSCGSSARFDARFRNIGSRLICGTTIALPLSTTLPVMPSPS